jgi:hypothetical protein
MYVTAIHEISDSEKSWEVARSATSEGFSAGMTLHPKLLL